MSQLKQLDNTEALFEFYALYASTVPSKDAEPFDRFIKWATIVLQDFNEIDRHLVEPTKIFKYLINDDFKSQFSFLIPNCLATF